MRQLRGLGGGNLPRCMADSYITTGRLVVKKTDAANAPCPCTMRGACPKR